MTRFRLRSLVLLIVFVAMALAIGVLTYQNHRLRTEVQRASQAERSARGEAELQRYLALKAEIQARQSLANSLQAEQAAKGK